MSNNTTPNIQYLYPEIKELISIVMPVYNSAKYLETMLDSIYAQTYPLIEVIAAYDTKSTDNSLEILNKYQNTRGLIIDSTRDESAGMARNRGARLARGEYIIFLDSDDIIIPTYLENLLEGFKQHPNINVVCGNYIWSCEDKVIDNYNTAIQSHNEFIILEKKEAIERWLPAKQYVRTGNLARTPWAYLVKRAYIINKHIYFPNFSYGEDQIYNSSLILNSDNIVYSKKIGYVYIAHSSSLCHFTKTIDELRKARLPFNDKLNELCTQENGGEYYKRRLAIAIKQLRVEELRLILPLSYPKYKRALKTYNITHLPYCEADSIFGRIFTLCFNVSKTGYWIIWKILREVSRIKSDLMKN